MAEQFSALQLQSRPRATQRVQTAPGLKKMNNPKGDRLAEPEIGFPRKEESLENH
jgi:hypothetical protein